MPGLPILTWLLPTPRPVMPQLEVHQSAVCGPVAARHHERHRVPRTRMSEGAVHPLAGVSMRTNCRRSRSVFTMTS
jgi:hypothetical protein